jgi:hypothetical protein
MRCPARVAATAPGDGRIRAPGEAEQKNRDSQQRTKHGNLRQSELSSTIAVCPAITKYFAQCHEPSWLDPGDPFPDAGLAWDASQPAPGLLAAGGALDVDSLHRAYSAAIFPWFSEGVPILWWSTDPRMVLFTRDFRLHRSLRKALARFVANRGASCGSIPLSPR